MKLLKEFTSKIPRIVNSSRTSKLCNDTLQIFERWVEQKWPLQPCDASTIEVTILEEQIARINRRFETGKVIDKDVDLMKHCLRAILR